MPESIGASSAVDDSTPADYATPGLPTDTVCADDGGTPCEDDGGDDDEKPDEEKPDEEKPHEKKPDDEEENGGVQKPRDDEGSEDDQKPADDDKPKDLITRTPLPTNEDGEVCTLLTEGEVVTVYSIIYSETITWTDDPSDYTPEFPVIPLPTYCDPTTTESTFSSTTSAPKLTSIPGDDNGWNTYCATLTNDTQSCTSEPIFNPSFVFTSSSHPRESRPMYPPPGPVTSTFYITSKNPTVVYPPEKTPDYGQDPDTEQPIRVPGNNGNIPADTNKPSNPESAVQRNPPKITITADPTRVIIGDHTLRDLKPGATTKITVGGNEYEVNPSQIVQDGGKTVNRPNTNQALVVAAPISTVVDGLAIAVSGSRAVIGGYTYTIGSTPSTEIVQGRTVIISPTGISFEDSDEGVSYEAAPPEQTGIIVAGGEMLTLIGSSVLVIHETTITYGPGISPQTQTVDDDTVVAGAKGVTGKSVV